MDLTELELNVSPADLMQLEFVAGDRPQNTPPRSSGICMDEVPLLLPP